MPVLREVQVVSQRVDVLDLRLGYRHRLESRDAAGDRNPPYGLAGNKRVAWTGQGAGGRATVTEVGAADGESRRVEQRRRENVAFRYRRRLASARAQSADPGKRRARGERADVVRGIVQLVII